MNYKTKVKRKLQSINGTRNKKIQNKIKNIKLRRKIKFITFFIIIITIYIMVINREKLFLGNLANKIEDKIMSVGIGGELPYQIDGENIITNNFGLINGNITVLTDSTFESISTSGKKISSRKHNLNNPIMRSSGNKSIIYDSGGRKYKIETCSRTLIENNYENNIINCAISEEGTYGLVTESKDYLSQIVIFNRYGEEKYKYYFAENYISDIDIRSDGGCAVVSGISTIGGELKSVVYIFKFDSERPEYTYECHENMIVSVKYLSRKVVAAIGDKGISIIDTWNDTSREFSYDSKALRCIDINKKFGLVYCLSNSKHSRVSEVIGIDKEGNLKFNLEINRCFDSIVYNFNNIFGVQNDTVFVYDILGNMKYQLDTGIISSKIIPISPSCVYTADCTCVKKICLK